MAWIDRMPVQATAPQIPGQLSLWEECEALEGEMLGYTREVDARVAVARLVEDSTRNVLNRLLEPERS